VNAFQSTPVARPTVAFKNVGSQTVPAFGVMQIVGCVVEDGVTFVTCTQPGTTLGTDYAINGPVRVDAGDKGMCHRTGMVRALYEGDSPAHGEGWGVRAGSWLLAKGYPTCVTAEGPQDANQGVLFGRLSPISKVLAETTTDIPPRSDDQPGSQTVRVRVWNGDELVVSDPEITFTACNWSDTSIAAHNILPFHRMQGEWIAEHADAPSAIVTVNGATHEESSCLWPGKITATGNGANAYCSSPFAGGGDCWLLVLNASVGSSSTAKTNLRSGDSYVGYRIGQRPADGRPIYAVRVEDNYLYHVVVPYPGVLAGAAIDMLLPTGQTVTATNWSNLTLRSGDCATLYKDLAASPTAGWYLVAARDAQDKQDIVSVYSETHDEATCLWQGKIVVANETATAYCSDPFGTGANCWLAVLNPSGGSSAASKMRLRFGDRYLARQVGVIAGVPVYAVHVDEPTRFVRFRLASALSLTQASSDNALVLDYWGGADPGAAVTVYNCATNLTGRYLFKGLQNAVGYAVYDARHDQWKIIVLEPPALVVEGTLSTNWSSEGTSAAVSNYYQGQSPGSTTTVHDSQELFKNAPSGAKYRAVWDDVAGKYRLINCERKARFITGTLSGSKTNGSVNKYWDGVSPGATVTLADPQNNFQYSASAPFHATYDPSADVYNLTWIGCP